MLITWFGVQISLEVSHNAHNALGIVAAVDLLERPRVGWKVMDFFWTCWGSFLHMPIFTPRVLRDHRRRFTFLTKIVSIIFHLIEGVCWEKGQVGI